MSFNELIKFIINKRKETIASIVFVFFVLSAVITFAQPLKYRADSRILVVQKMGQMSDAYSVSRSNQYIGNILAQVVNSDTFYIDVMSSGYLNPEIFSLDNVKRKKQWESTVKTRAISDTGMINIYTYHQNKAIASQLNESIANTLKYKNSQYHGMGDNVEIKIIDNTTVSKWPVKPNIIINLLLGIIAGLVAGFMFVAYYPDEDLKVISRRNKIVYTKSNGYNMHGNTKQVFTPEINNTTASPIFNDSIKNINTNEEIFTPSNISSLLDN